ncbi:MAG: pyridoxal phosphate-dependent aminotransferase [Candidatus Altiarchaeota archaeon]
MKLKLTENLDGIVPDPVRYWVKVAKDAGAVNNFTIGVPDPIPKDVIEFYAKIQYESEAKGVTSYPPFDGEENLKKAIIRMEPNFGAELTDEDVDRLYVMVGASQALQFVFSLFPAGGEVLVNTPCWGTIHNMAAHSGVKGVPVSLFKGGKFIEENAAKALTKKTRAVYVNYPVNPTGEIVPEAGLRDMCGWAASNNLQIISDEPYKYSIYDMEKTPYTSPVSFASDIKRKVSLISSFSKIVKPDIRLGFIRVSPEILESHAMVGYYLRNLSAGAPRGVQAGITALVERDPKLKFLRPIVEGYRLKSELIQKYLLEWGSKLPYKPAAAYMLFPTTPDGSDGDDFVRRMIKEEKTSFVPGSSFGGNFKGFEHLKKHFRIGFGGGMTKEKITEVMEKLIK